MASSTIIPTRMVLKQLKGWLKTARRGHKLLKDKRDEMMRQFMEIVKRNKELRLSVEQGLTDAFAALQVASSIMSPEMLEQALLYPRQSVELDVSTREERVESEAESTNTTTSPIRISGNAESRSAGTIVSNSGLPFTTLMRVLPVASASAASVVV